MLRAASLSSMLNGGWLGIVFCWIVPGMYMFSALVVKTDCVEDVTEV